VIAAETATTPNASCRNSFVTQPIPNPPETTWRKLIHGEVDFLVAGVGSGTLTGVEVMGRETRWAVAVEPVSSPVISGGKPGAHKIQGIGAGFIPEKT